MAVHRISDRAERLLAEIISLEGGKPSEVLSRLVIDFHAGLSFAADADQPPPPPATKGAD